MKLVLIGAGSYVFAPSVIHDFVLDHGIPGSDLVLVDLDVACAELMAVFGRRLARESGRDVTLTACADRREALPGADAVILSAAVQGMRRWRMDADILAKHGLGLQTAECARLAGLSYGLRSATLALAVARDMEDLCPGAALLDVTNPMPKVVTAVRRFTRVPAFGFCNAAHGGYGGYRWFASLLGLPAERLDVTTAGLNHFSWLLAARDRETGEDLRERIQSAVRAGTDARSIEARELLDAWGAAPAPHPGHVREFLPHDAPGAWMKRSSPFHGSPAERAERVGVLRAAAEERAAWKPALAHRSWERPVDFAVALLMKSDLNLDMLNLPNCAYLPDIPDGRVVEVPVHVRKGVVEGVPVPPLPAGLAGLCRRVSDAHELTARAAATGDRRVAHEVIRLDPSIPDVPAAHAALDKMLAAHADVLSPFA